MTEKLSINIKTDTEDSFNYPLPVKSGDPNGDVLPRDIKVKDLTNVSNCERKRYEIPH